MPGSWIETTLGNVLTLKRGYDLPEQDRIPGPHPIVSSSGITGRHREAKVKGPGVVTGRYGTLGEVHYIAEDYWPLNTTLFVEDFHGNEPRFIAYFLKCLDFRAFSDKSSVPGLNRNHLHAAVVRFPRDVAEQRAIAAVLGALDDKIELNRRMCRTLEGIAQALFQAWFVDFLPVRAKTAGAKSFRGMPQAVFDSLPTQFVDSPLGPIPKGWQVLPFDQTVSVLGGGTPKTSVPEFWDGDIPWFCVVDAPPDGTVWVIDTKKRITQVGLENSSARVLPVGTTIISARGTVGRIGLVAVPMAINQSCYGLRGRTGTHGYFTYFSTQRLIGTLRQRSHGCVFETITRDTLAGVSVIQPGTELVNQFEAVVHAALERMRRALSQSRSAAAIRDALLPKLVLGELRIRDVERIIARCT